MYLSSSQVIMTSDDNVSPALVGGHYRLIGLPCVTEMINFLYRETYKNPISISSLSEILQKLKDDQEFFEAYYRRMWVNIGSDFLKGCDENCRKTELCLIENPKNDDLNKCLPKEPASATGLQPLVTLIAMLALFVQVSS